MDSHIKHSTAESTLIGVSGGLASHESGKPKRLADSTISKIGSDISDAEADIEHFWDEQSTAAKATIIGVPVVLAGMAVYSRSKDGKKESTGESHHAPPEAHTEVHPTYPAHRGGKRRLAPVDESPEFDLPPKQDHKLRSNGERTEPTYNPDEYAGHMPKPPRDFDVRHDVSHSVVRANSRAGLDPTHPDFLDPKHLTSAQLDHELARVKALLNSDRTLDMSLPRDARNLLNKAATNLQAEKVQRYKAEAQRRFESDLDSLVASRDKLLDGKPANASNWKEVSDSLRRERALREQYQALGIDNAQTYQPSFRKAEPGDTDVAVDPKVSDKIEANQSIPDPAKGRDRSTVDMGTLTDDQRLEAKKRESSTETSHQPDEKIEDF